MGSGGREGMGRKENSSQCFLSDLIVNFFFHVCCSQWFKLHWLDGATREYRQPSQDPPGARIWMFWDCWSSGGQRQRIRGNVLTSDWKDDIHLESIKIIKEYARYVWNNLYRVLLLLSHYLGLLTVVVNDRTFQTSHTFPMYHLVVPGNGLVKGPGETLASPLFILYSY